MALPDTKWRSIMIDNPRWRWWAFWRPRKVVDPTVFLELNEIMTDFVWLDNSPIVPARYRKD